MIPYADIERIARRMCEMLGVDPDSDVVGAYWQALTLYERMHQPYEYLQHPVSLPAWRWMVQHAERSAAGFIAVDEIWHEAWRSKKET